MTDIWEQSDENSSIHRRKLGLLTRMEQLTQQQWVDLNPFSKWLLMIRAPVLIMTLIPPLLALFLAGLDVFKPLHFFCLMTGLLAAHATNNLLNDLVDWYQGVDEEQ